MFKNNVARCLLLQIGLLIFLTLPANSHVKSGIDVSSYQGTIDWHAVKKSGVSFAIARATYGAEKQDTTFLTNWSNMKKHNIRPAAYHYFLGKDTTASQVYNIESCLSKTDFNKTNNILVIDVESTGNTGVSAVDMATNLHSLLSNLSDYTNLYIYCSYYYWEYAVAWRMFDFSRHGLWIAYWHSSSKSSPPIPSTWKNKGYKWWQYSSKGNISGISGYVDLDRSAR